MGWAKYSEDNWDAIYERLSERDSLNSFSLHRNGTSGVSITENNTIKKETAFAKNHKGESCFSM